MESKFGLEETQKIERQKEKENVDHLTNCEKMRDKRKKKSIQERRRQINC